MHHGEAEITVLDRHSANVAHAIHSSEQCWSMAIMLKIPGRVWLRIEVHH